MKPFTSTQELNVQEKLNENFSFHGKLDVSEDNMRGITTDALGITDYKSKANFMFYDCRAADIGIEFKKRKFTNPESQIGKLVDFTTSRTIDKVPTDDAPAAIEYIAKAYNSAIDEFNVSCNNNVWFGGALYSEDTLVYYHERIEKLDVNVLEGRWDWSAGTKNAAKTYNLYVKNKLTGEHAFTYLTKGEKLQVKFRVPDSENVHVFKAQQTMVYVGIPVKQYETIQYKYGSFDNAIEKIAI